MEIQILKNSHLDFRQYQWIVSNYLAQIYYVSFYFRTFVKGLISFTDICAITFGLFEENQHGWRG